MKVCHTTPLRTKTKCQRFTDVDKRKQNNVVQSPWNCMQDFLCSRCSEGDELQAWYRLQRGLQRLLLFVDPKCS